MQTTITNRAFVDYEFRLPNGIVVTDSLVTNNVIVQLVYPVIGVQLEVDPPIVEADEAFHTEVRISNTGNYSTDVTLRDFIPNETTLVPNSVSVNGQAIPGAPIDSIFIGSLPAGGLATVTYRLRVYHNPLQRRIRFRVRATYSYTVNMEHTGSSAFSNEASVRIETDDE